MARLRFGLFEFDPATSELRREGALVRLQSQPAQVLALLVANAGEVVTREALREAVWGTDTFVDFDRGLNFCIAQIRGALGDSAESPRFVRTLPKRGYQFIAPVDKNGAKAVTHSRPFSKWWLAAAVPLLLPLFFLLRPAPSIRVAVARFDNETGNAELDRFADGLTDSVVAELTAAGGGKYGVIGNAAILRQPRNQRDLLAIGSSLRAGYVVLGQVQRNASRTRVLAHLIRLPEQTHLWVTRFETDVDDPLRTEADLAHRIVTEFSRKLAATR